MPEKSCQDYLSGNAFRAFLLLALVILAVCFSRYPIHHKDDRNTGNQASSVSISNETHETILERVLNDPGAFSNLIVAGFTAVLSVVAIAQLFLLFRADKTSNRSVEAAIKAATVAEKALEGGETPFLSISAEILAHVQSDSISNIVNPRLKGNVKITLTNHGRSPAILMEVFQTWIVTEGVHFPPPVTFPPPGKNPGRIIEIGPDRVADPLFVNDVFNFEEVVSPERKEIGWLLVQARYKDMFGSQFVAGFTLVYGSNTGMMFTVGGKEYNYKRKLSDAEADLADKRDQFK